MIDGIAMHHGRLEDVLPTLLDSSVDHVITDPPYSAHVHNSVRSSKRNEAPDVSEFECRTRRMVNLGFDHLTAVTRRFCANEFARIARRWVIVFGDDRTAHWWRLSLEGAGLEFVRMMAWVRVGAAPQFSGDRPSSGGLTSVTQEMRRRGLQTGHGSRMTVLHTLVGGLAEERALHRRFDASRTKDGGEFFFRTKEIDAWLATLDPHVEADPRETALQWLRRVGSPNAIKAIDSWKAMEEHGRSTGSCSHTLWDMLAGAKGKIHPLLGTTTVVLKGKCFEFPLFAEACIRQGTHPPAGAQVAKKMPKSHRTPQRKRWGEKLRAAQRRRFT